MTDLFFLPDWPPPAPAMLWFAVLLLAATLAGELVHAVLRLPRMLGWLTVGIGFGPLGLDLIDATKEPGYRVLLDVAVGIVLFELGQRVDLGWLRRNPWLLATSVVEAALAFGAVLGLLLLLGIEPLPAAVAAAIAMATSPAVMLTVTKEAEAQGQVTERMLLLTALNSMYAFVSVAMLLGWLHLAYRGGWLTIIAHPLYLIAGSIGLALAAAALTLILLGRLRYRERVQLPLILAVVVATVALAVSFKLSVVIVMLAFGTLTRVLDRTRSFMTVRFGGVSPLAAAVLFALAGTTLRVDIAPSILVAAVGLIAARQLAKTVGVLAFARPSGISFRKASLVGLGLAPMSLLALALLRDATELYPELGPGLSVLVVSSIAILELVGPVATQFAVRRAGETDGR